jgi:hypothetical protein
VWLLSALLACAALGSFETVFRGAGHTPSVVDDMALWSLHRSQVYRRGNETPFVVLGASRIQLGFVPKELEGRYPHYRPVQLAIDGRYPWATLRDLALDENFRGIVLCSMKAEGFLKSHWEDQTPYVAYYHDQFNTNTALNARISSYLQGKVALLYPTLRADEVLLHLLKYRSLPSPPYLRTFPDRSRAADYSMLDIAEHRRMRIATTEEYYANRAYVSPAQWLKEAMEIEPYVRKIQGRGGKVVFLQCPSTGEYWAYEEKTCPKAQYWDVLARQTSATTIHFQDFPELACFDCPDTSHLDFRDAVPFTRALLRILEERRIIDRP